MGARAIPLRPGATSGLHELSGLVISGGSDINPALYLSTGGPWVAADPQRDAFELAALEYAGQQDLPVLGICRGAQLINISAGGSLHADITNLRRVTSNRPTLRPSKTVAVEAGSRLAQAMGSTLVHVNSLHHQAVDALGHSLRVVARDRDQIIQGIEFVGERFCVGVQWHPEYLPWKSTQRRLFAALVDSARKRDAQRPAYTGSA